MCSKTQQQIKTLPYHVESGTAAVARCVPVPLPVQVSATDLITRNAQFVYSTLGLRHVTVADGDENFSNWRRRPSYSQLITILSNNTERRVVSLQ